MHPIPVTAGLVRAPRAAGSMLRRLAGFAWGSGAAGSMLRRLACASILAAGPALADERAPLHRAQAPGHNPLDCYCRAQGRIFAPGETVCLRTGEGGRLAECRMEINVMSWTPTDRPCPES